MESKKGFASDNNSGVLPEILKAIAAVNEGHVPAYGHDEVTEAARKRFKEVFGPQAEAFFVFNGTAANVLCLKAMTRPHNSILCAETSHMNQSECGAPERFTGCKVIAVATDDGKLRPDQLERYMGRWGDPHASQPRVLSITQPTEVGTVYALEEIKALSAFCRKHGLLLHMDGARLVNAAAALGLSLGAITTEAGVDALSFGGTKNGLLFGEAVVLLKPELAKSFQFTHKQAMQLSSKTRFMAAQFLALLDGDLWLRNARHANAMAKLLEEETRGIPAVRITQPVQSNAVFAVIPRERFEELRGRYFFYVWEERTFECRWMTTFDTKPEDIRGFARLLRETLGA